MQNFFQQFGFKGFFKYSFLLLFGCFIFIALASFQNDDASLNFVSSNAQPAKNLMGSIGAYFADPLLQFFGFATFLLILPLFFWSYQGFKQKKSHNAVLKIFGLLSFLLISSMFLSLIPNFSERFSDFEFGGFVGLFLLTQWQNLFAHFHFTEYKFFFDISLFILNIYIFLKIIGLEFSSSMFKVLPIGSLKLRDNDQTKHKRQNPEKKKTIRKSKNSSFDSVEEFALPSTDLLKEISEAKKNDEIPKAILEENSNRLQEVLQDFGVNCKIGNVYPGPVVTLYEIEPAAGTKSSRVISLADDIARSMSSVSARIAVLPGKNALGAELPNESRKIIYLKSLLQSKAYLDNSCKLPIILGKNISDDDIIVDLAKMPHLLVAGTTGSGKSVAINTMILSLLYRLSPDECKFIMIDPKMLELSVYDGIPHLLTPVVTEPSKAVTALKWVVKEMENRYRLMSNVGVRNIEGYNKTMKDAIAKGEKIEKTIQTGFNQETGKPIYEKIPIEMEELPFIVVIVDEMADLMIVAGKDIEGSIQRLAQMARAAGIHIIMATQRPSVDVITGVIKANFPTRISFQVTSKIDSRTIIGEQGAEQLLGMGDMLYLGGGSKLTRVHGPFVADDEVEKVVSFLKQSAAPTYRAEITEDDNGELGENSDSGDANSVNKDASLYDQAVAIILRDKKVSTSYVQRSLRIGYNRAADIVDKMEQEGIISKPNHAGKREILVPDQEN